MSAATALASAIAASCVLLLPAQRTLGFGVEGHRIAGRVAEAFLCEEARAGLQSLGARGGLAELGSWADRIRGDARWAHTAPWHFMNIDDDAPLERHRTPPEGDILWAIAHFRTQLADASRPVAARLNALRFLTHFIVDLHQPLHVGRGSDRGGNRISVTLPDGELVSLHRFWDVEAVRLAGWDETRYAESALFLADARAALWAAGTPLDWARESQSLRPRVYEFEGVAGSLPATYIGAAVGIARQRLAQAGVRLAFTINRSFCTRVANDTASAGRERTRRDVSPERSSEPRD